MRKLAGDSRAAVVDRIVTDLAVFDVTPEGLVLVEAAPGVDVDELRGLTGAPFVVEGVEE